MRLSSAATMPMWGGFRISENRTRRASIQANPDAFRSHGFGSPPPTGTDQVSQSKRSLTRV
jgi:hypothetical protein